MPSAAVMDHQQQRVRAGIDRHQHRPQQWTGCEIDSVESNSRAYSSTPPLVRTGRSADGAAVRAGAPSASRFRCTVHQHGMNTMSTAPLLSVEVAAECDGQRQPDSPRRRIGQEISPRLWLGACGIRTSPGAARVALPDGCRTPSRQPAGRRASTVGWSRRPRAGMLRSPVFGVIREIGCRGQRSRRVRRSHRLQRSTRLGAR